MLCECYWIALYIVHVTAFCLGGAFFSWHGVESLAYISVADGSIFIQICAVGSKRRIFSATECVLAVQGHSESSKVDDFGTNRKRVCDFLLVINSNYGPILHRFWDTATYWLTIAYFSHPSLIWRPRSLCSLWNFEAKLTMRQLESWGYPPVKTAWS